MEMMMAHLRPVVPLPVTADEIYLRTMMTAIESLRTGATTIVDDMSLGQTFDRSHVEAALQAYEDSGLRVYLGFSMIDKPVVDSWPFVEESFAPDVLQWLRSLPRPRGDALLDLVRDVAKTRHPKTSRVGVIVAPSAPQRCTDGFLRECRALADELDLPIIVHVLETRMQAVTAELFWGRTASGFRRATGRSSPDPARAFSTTPGAMPRSARAPRIFARCAMPASTSAWVRTAAASPSRAQCC
jgi:guanine deaminase